jgi:hypothetical protein
VLVVVELVVELDVEGASELVVVVVVLAASVHAAASKAIATAAEANLVRYMGRQARRVGVTVRSMLLQRHLSAQ